MPGINSNGACSDVEHDYKRAVSRFARLPQVDS